MGYYEYEEDYCGGQCDDEDFGEIEAEKDQYLHDRVWKSFDGVETPVKELENDHLNAIIKWINDNGFHRGAEWIEVLEEEAEKRNRDMFNNMDG